MKMFQNTLRRSSCSIQSEGGHSGFGLKIASGMSVSPSSTLSWRYSAVLVSDATMGQALSGSPLPIYGYVLTECSTSGHGYRTHMREHDDNQGLEVLNRETVACPRNDQIPQSFNFSLNAIGREAAFRYV